MTETKTSTDTPSDEALAARAQPAEAPTEAIVTCDACPVLCRIRPGKTGACDRYGNVDGKLMRSDPIVLAQRTLAREGAMVPFLADTQWQTLVRSGDTFVTGIGAGTTYPDYKPAPFIVSSKVEGIDMITVVTEGIFSYCGLKLKIDTDRYVGPEQAAVRVAGEQVGHVTTAEYGSQMLSLGGVRHLTGGSKKEGSVTCQAMPHPMQQGRGRGDGRRRRDAHRAGGGAAGGQRRARGAHARGLRLGDHRHVRQAVARPCRRGDRGRRPHHRRADGASGRALPRHDAGRHPRARPPLDARSLLPGRQSRHRLGRHRCLRPARHHREDRPPRPRGPDCAS